MNILNELAEQGLFFGYMPSGEFVTVQDLLQRQKGRECSYEEAVQFVRKAQFMAGIRKHSKFHSEITA